MPARPPKPIQPDETSQTVRMALPLLREAVEYLRDARDRFDEAAEIKGLPPDLAGSFGTYEAVVESLRQTLVGTAKWLDDKAELQYSSHSPLQHKGAGE